MKERPVMLSLILDRYFCYLYITHTLQYLFRANTYCIVMMILCNL